ncbi:MAG: hypothetical protein MR384_03245 [Lachnospiraceae bacterium]|nr:hypothetical protein [Lachnospiraceae bacterium]
MATNIALVIAAVFAVGLSVWCWLFENGGSDDDKEETETADDEKQNV